MRILSAMVCAVCPALVLSASPAYGEEALIGDDLSGWTGSTGDWSIEDGVLIGTADGSLKSNRFIVSKTPPVKNFELTVDVWVSAAGNSGIQYRSVERPDIAEYAMHGYQCDVVARQTHYNGMLYEEKGRRILALTGQRVVLDPEGQPWIVGQFDVKRFEPEQWHTYKVVVRGNHHQHFIDGHQTVDVVDLDDRKEGRRLEGKIGVQVHVGPPMTIKYRNLELTRLADDLPLQTPSDVAIPVGSEMVEPQGGWKRSGRTPKRYGE